MTVSQHVDDLPRTPLQALASRWPVAVGLSLLGLLIGVAIALVVPTTYTAEARVAVNAGGLSGGAVAGLPLAASDLASNYARYVNDQALADTGGQESVAASPIPDSNVVRVEGFATSRDEAQQVAQSAAKSLVAQVQKSSGGSDKELLASYSSAAESSARADDAKQAAPTRVASLRASDGSAAALRKARSQLVAATQEAATAQLRASALGSRYQNAVSSTANAQVSLIQSSELTASDRVGRVGRYGILGLVLGAVGALVLSSVLERRRSSRR